MPGSSLVTTLLKDDSTYDLWSRQMKNQLLGKNKWGYVDGTFPRPKKDIEKQALWDQSQAALISWFEKSVESSLVSFISRKGDVQIVWEHFQERFGKVTSTQSYNLRQKQFENQLAGTSVTDYYSKLSDLWAQIQTVEAPVRCNCGGCTCRVNERLEEQTEKHNLWDFLLGLPESFQNFRTNILSKDPLPSVDKAFNLAKEDEHQRHGNETRGKNVENVALTASSRTHIQQNSSPTAANDAGVKIDSKGRAVCAHCHRLGHSKDKCYRLVGFPPGWTPKGKGKQPGQVFQVGGTKPEHAQHDPPMGSVGQNFSGVGQTLGQYAGSSMPHIFYPGTHSPIPVQYGPGSHGFPQQVGSSPYGTPFPHSQPHLQQPNHQQTGSSSFAGSMTQPMGQMIQSPSITMDQLQGMFNAYNMDSPGNHPGLYDWAGDRTG